MMLGNVSNTFIMPQVRAVIACRVTPLQKAEIVRPTSAPGPRPPLPHQHRDWAHPCQTCAGTGLTPLTSAPRLGPALPHLRWDRARPCHVGAGDRARPL